MKEGRAFTLIEVLVVLLLTGMTFSVLLLVFSRGMDSSLNLSASSEKLKTEASLFWELQRKIVGAKELKIERDGIYMFTTGGSFSPGIVKCAYLFKEGKLYYYEFPYPYGAIDELVEGNLYEVGAFESFKVTAYKGNREFKVYEGLPDRVKVSLDGREFLFETLSQGN